jgi:pimeloyl-ACP methyl ester carboxylesterase
MLHEETKINVKNYMIRAEIKIPSNRNSKIGIVLAHGGIINRKSLLRKKYCFGEFLCEKLQAHVIAPDFLGETIHKNRISFNNYSEILNHSTKYLVEKYDIEEVMGFGHSMGSYVLANSLSSNPHLGSIVNYGGPIKELEKTRQKNLIQYLINYLSTYDYKIDVRNLINYIFDGETCRYLQEVMLKDKDYGYENYDFTFDSNIFKDVSQVIEHYEELLKKWEKPVLLLFGTEDTLTKRTRKYYKNNQKSENITIKHIKGASHVTPCMETKNNLTKLNDVLAFYRNNHKIIIKQNQEITIK